MADEITIPALPCRSINETVDFYEALGFEITYRQTRPNGYACVQREGIELHFFALRSLDPAQSYSTCIVLVSDADALYAAFASSLRQHYGRLPVAGIPRISRPNNNNSAGERRFNVVDPGGNWIRFIQKGQPAPNEAEAGLAEAAPTRLSRATHAAELLADSKGDFAAAATMLDTALAREEPAPPVHRLRALLLRAEVAVNMEDLPLARRLLGMILAVPLSQAERAALAGELERAHEMEKLLS